MARATSIAPYFYYEFHSKWTARTPLASTASQPASPRSAKLIRLWSVHRFPGAARSPYERRYAHPFGTNSHDVGLGTFRQIHKSACALDCPKTYLRLPFAFRCSRACYHLSRHLRGCKEPRISPILCVQLALAIAVAGCSQESCSKAADGHHPPAERRGSDGFERVLSCAVAYDLDPCRRRSVGPSLELFVTFRPVAVLSWRLDMCLPPESGWSCVDVRPSS